jgi:hypothetical protein
MNNKYPKLAAILAVTLSLGVTTTVYATHFGAPANLTCSNDNTDITAFWFRTGAPKYGGDFIVTYANDPPETFDFSVFDPLTSIIVAIADLNSTPNGEAPDSVEVTVKSLHPGQGQGSQNSAVSGPVDCGV